MERLELKMEKLFMDVALAEGQCFPTLVDELDCAAETFECSFVDVAFAEAGNLTESACRPRH